MELLQAFKKYIKDISWYQESNDFWREIEQFISANKGLSDPEMIEKIYSVYGTRIKFFEEATRYKQLASIKGWISLFGVLTILGIIIGVFFVLATTH